MDIPITKVFRSRFTSRLFTYILANPGITGSELAKEHRLLPTVISRSLKILRAAGLVRISLEEGGKSGIKRIYPSIGNIFNNYVGKVLTQQEIDALDIITTHPDNIKFMENAVEKTKGEDIHKLITKLMLAAVFQLEKMAFEKEDSDIKAAFEILQKEKTIDKIKDSVSKFIVV